MQVLTGRRTLIGSLLALLPLLLAALLTVPACAAAVQTARLMPAFFADLPLDLSGPGAAAIVYETSPLPDATGAVLHTWRPASGRHPALVVSLGVNPAPPDDPRVVRLFRGLAGVGLVAVLVESADLNEDRITPAAPDLIVHAVEHMATSRWVRDGRVGLLGFSVGAAMVELAAADARIRDRITLVEAFGGYARLEDVVIAATTGTIRYGDGVEAWAPDPVTILAVRKNLIAGISSPADREALTRALVDQTDPFPALATLSEDGRAVLAVLLNADPARAADLFAALPAAQRAEMEALSPLGRLPQIHARVYLMHDRGDELLPYVESRRARDTLTAAGRPPYYSEFSIFEHVDPTRGGNPLVLARDGVRLFLHAYWLLRQLQ